MVNSLKAGFMFGKRVGEKKQTNQIREKQQQKRNQLEAGEKGKSRSLWLQSVGWSSASHTSFHVCVCVCVQLCPTLCVCGFSYVRPCVSVFSCVRFPAIPWTVACQAFLFTDFSRQEVGCHFLSQGNLPNSRY